MQCTNPAHWSAYLNQFYFYFIVGGFQSFYFICLSRTLTTPVELIKCLKSIKEHAFVASEYPVVITLEDHLTPDLQAKVAEVCVWCLTGELSNSTALQSLFSLLNVDD